MDKDGFIEDFDEEGEYDEEGELEGDYDSEEDGAPANGDLGKKREHEGSPD